MAIAAALLILLVAAPAAFGAQQHVVGGSSAWNQGVDYTTWAAGQTFTVGDTLLFTYGLTHSVDVVSQSAYSSCSSSNPLNSYSGGNTVISLNSTGSMYFICPTAGHCQSGMKLSITVLAATPAISGSPPATTTSSPTSPPPSSSAVAINFGGKMYLLVEVSFLVVVLIGFMG